MGTIRFFLRTDKVDKNGLSPIELIYSIEGKREYFRTKEKLPEANWIQKDLKNPGKSQKAIYVDKKAAKLMNPVPDFNSLLSDREVKDINNNLTALEKLVRDTENLFTLSKKIYSTKDVINVIKESDVPKTKEEPAPKQLFNFIDKYIREHQTTRKSSSLSVYGALKVHLENYQIYKKREVTFENMDYSFFQDFQNFLIDKRNLNNTTVAKQISTVKTFINYARLHGVAVSDKYKDFKIKKQVLEVIALTNEEFEKLFYLNLAFTKKLDQVRDVFCFACVTGLRYSDLKQLSRTHISEEEITLTIQKTGTQLTIPLNPYSRKILSKYKAHMNPLPVISNQKMNDYLKGWTTKDRRKGHENEKITHTGLCKLAGIDTPTEIVRFRGAKREVNVYPKYELVGVHTARKTFATLSLEKGMSAEETMAITGHLDYKSFQRYVKITETRKKVVMAKAWTMPKKNNLRAS